MKLLPVRLLPENSAAAQVILVCCKTGEREKWNDAARKGWQWDREGEPFNAYYSPLGLFETVKLFGPDKTNKAIAI